MVKLEIDPLCDPHLLESMVFLVHVLFLAVSCCLTSMAVPSIAREALSHHTAVVSHCSVINGGGGGVLVVMVIMLLMMLRNATGNHLTHLIPRWRKSQ